MGEPGERDRTDGRASTDESTGVGTTNGTDAADEAPELPREVQREARRLTRLARDAVDPGETAAYEADRESLLAEHGFTARLRHEDDTLVLHPEEWLADGVVEPARIDDIDRAVERPLEGGRGDDTYEDVEAHNAALAEAVADTHGPVHGANARAFADFMGNHYLQRAETATARQLREFVDEYFPRNAWPSDEQRAVVAESVRFVFEAAEATSPEF